MGRCANAILAGCCVAGVLGSASVSTALTKQQMLQILGSSTLMPSAATTPAVAYVAPATVSVGVLDQVGGGGPLFQISTLGHPQWVVMYNPTPCAEWEHPASAVLIDDVTGIVTTFALTNWVTIDGTPLGGGTGTMTNLIRVYSMLALGGPTVPVLARSTPGQWGAAPDGQAAYTGVIGQFPTLPTSTTGAVGIRFRLPNLETFGVTNTIERGPADPADPDGRPNLVDGDTSPRMFLAWDPNGPTATGYLVYDVAVSIKAINTIRYVNLVLDFNQNGQWNRPVGGPNEWAVMNQPVVVFPGTKRTFCSPGFAWGTGAPSAGPFMLWGRATLARTPLPPFPQPWDGSGSYTYGDVHDYCIQLRTCPLPCKPGSPAVPVPGSPEPDPDGGGGHDHGGGHPPPVGWDGQPIHCYALVVAGADHPGDAFVAGSAASMAKFLRANGWTTTTLSGAASNAAGMCTAIANIAAAVHCQDKVMIYICAHGRKMVAGGLMRMGDGTVMTGAQFKACLAQIPPCPGQLCNVPGCCNVTVLIESCYSGQLAGVMAGPGRTIITSTSSDHPSWATPAAGIFTTAFEMCSKDTAADADGDGWTSPAEAGAWAATMLPSTPEPQVPTQSNQKCTCQCPPTTPDGCTNMPMISGDGAFVYDNSLTPTDSFGQVTTQCLASSQIGIAHDVWFKWIAPFDGVATLSTCGGTNLDTKCAVYDTTDCLQTSSPACIGCNDDDPTCATNTLASTVRFACVQFHPYLLQLGNYPGSPGGPTVVRLSTLPPPFNDSCDRFYDVLFTVGPDGVTRATIPFDLTTARMGEQGQGPDLCTSLSGPLMDHDEWFAFTAPCTGPMQVGACLTGSTVAAKVKVYQFPLGADCTAPTGLGPAIACAESTPSGGCASPPAVLNAVEGQRYMVQVGTPVGAAAGPGTLTIACPAPACTISQPAGGITESEPCGQRINDGCTAPPPNPQPIPVEIIALGLTSALPIGNPPLPDIDWWLVQPWSPGMYTIGLVSDVGQLNALILGGPSASDCAGLQTLGTLQANKCQPAYRSVMSTQPALIVAVGPPAAGTGAACGNLSGNRYNLEIVQASQTSPCCLPLRECVVIDQAGCTEAGGIWQPGAASCTASPCPNPCLADINNDGMVSVQDLFDFLGFWFGGDLRADINGNGQVSVQDIFDYLAAWFNHC